MRKCTATFIIYLSVLLNIINNPCVYLRGYAGYPMSDFFNVLLKLFLEKVNVRCQEYIL